MKIKTNAFFIEDLKKTRKNLCKNFQAAFQDFIEGMGKQKMLVCMDLLDAFDGGIHKDENLSDDERHEIFSINEDSEI